MADNKFLELVTVILAAGDSRVFEVAGDYFEVIDATYPVTVILSDRNGAQRGRMANAEASFFIRDTDYQSITITSANAQTVRFGFGSGEAGTRRTSGIVQVVDGGKARTLANVAFMGSISGGLPAAGFYSNGALKNPAASGKNLIIKSLYISSPNANSVNFGKFPVGLNSTALDQVGYSKNFGSAVPSSGLLAADITTYNTSWAAGATTNMGQLACNANSRDSLKFDEPIIVPPGQCMRMSTQNPAIVVAFGFEWFEEVI